MLIKTTKTEEIEIEMEMPSYFEYGNSIAKILSEKSYIAVHNGSISKSIEHFFDNIYTAGLFIHKGTPTTKLEFETKFSKVLTYLTNQ